MRFVATNFEKLLDRSATRGFIALVAPATIDELADEKRLLRDVEEDLTIDTDRTSS